MLLSLDYYSYNSRIQHIQQKYETTGWATGPTEGVYFEGENIILQLHGGDNDEIMEKDGWKIIPVNKLEVGMEIHETYQYSVRQSQLCYIYVGVLL